jgi:hypothetical protein
MADNAVPMHPGRAAEIIQRGDPAAIVGMSVRAMLAANRDEYCCCETPDVVGYDTLCGACLLENEAQIAKRLARINGPHAFEPRGESGLKARMCAICARPDYNERHQS